jgi:flagellar biosynthesis regulator FlaF
MDESNNTPDIIGEAFAIIDIGVWVTKGTEKIIQRITVNKTGGTSSGGFTTA